MKKDEKWMIGFFSNSIRMTPYLKWKIVVTMRYFHMWCGNTPEICWTDVLIIDRDKDVSTYHLPERFPHRLIQTQARYIRHAKRFANVIDLDRCHPRYLPNMRMMNDEFYHEKRDLAVRKNEISLLWYCSEKIRELAFSRHIYSFDHPHFLSSIIDQSLSPEQSVIIHQIVEMNRVCNDNKWIMVPDHIDFVDPSDCVYVDFEYDEKNRVYLIGVFDSDDGYISFWSKDLGDNNDKIFRDFDAWLSHRKKRYCVYWYAEEKILEHDAPPLDSDYEWIDLWKTFRYSPIIVRGAFNFSLKSIVRAFYDQGVCKRSYDQLECQNGEESLRLMKDVFHSNSVSAKKALEDYNRADCEHMFFIHHYLFHNHC